MRNHHHFYKKPLLGLALIALVYGIYNYTQLKTGLFPDITFPKIKVIANSGQQPVDKMMAKVTVPLENIIKRTEGLDYIRSTTARGSCEISVFLKWNTDVDNALLQVQSLVNQIKGDLLPETEIEVQKMNPSILPVMGFFIDGNRSLIELKKIAQYQVKPFLAAVPGVADVVVTGGKTKEYQIVLKPEKLSELRITPKTIADIISASNILLSNGYVNDYGRMYLTLTDNSIKNKKELEDLVLVNSPKRTVKLSEVADIKIAEAKEYVKINANGKNVPLIGVVKQANANLIDVNVGVLEKLKEIQKTLPRDVKIKPFYLQADFVNSSMESIRDVLWIGLLLAIFVIILFLRSWRSSLAVLLTIPITLALTLILMHVFGYTFNIMTLGAIAAAIGLIIDDAIVVVEQVYRIHEERQEDSMESNVGAAIRFLFPAMVGSSLSTILIFVPFVMLSGVAGAYFQVLAFTMIITLSASFISTWLILPVLLLAFPEKERKKKKELTPTSGNWLKFFLRYPAISITMIIGFGLMLYFIPQHLPSGFLPEMDEGGIVLDYVSPAGTTLEETDLMLQKVDKIIKEQPEVESFSRRTGAQMGFFITEPNNGDYLIQLKKDRNKTTDEVSDDIRKRIEESIPQLQVDFGQVIGDMLGDLMSSVQPIEIKVFGNNQKKIEEISKQIADSVTKVTGTADVFDGIVIAGPEAVAHPDVAKLAQFGITPADFQFQLQTQLEGNVVTTIMESEQMVDVRMIYPDVQHTNIDKLRKGNLFLPDGLLKPLNTVAEITTEKGVSEINRENQKMMGVVTARLNNRDLGSTLKDIQAKLKFSMPDGYHIEYGGSYAQQKTAFSELLFVLLTACLLVFIVILALFREFLISFAIILMALLGAAGCLFALYITGTPLNVGSYVGIIMIVGIIGENAIFTYQQFILGRETRDVKESLIFAIATRLRPRVMTALGAIIAMLPLALGIGAGAQLHQPLAIAVIGGFVFALPLLLIVFPTLLMIIKRKQ